MSVTPTKRRSTASSRVLGKQSYNAEDRLKARRVDEDGSCSHAHQASHHSDHLSPHSTHHAQHPHLHLSIRTLYVISHSFLLIVPHLSVMHAFLFFL